MNTADPSIIADRARAVMARIEAAGAEPSTVKLLAVTKGFGPEVVIGALEAGLELLGESYVQEFNAKLSVLGAEAAIDAEAPHWHFIGRLQRNKVRSLPPVDVIQSVDRRSLVTEIARRLPEQKILVQVNIGNEAQKGGCPISETDDLVGFAVDSGLNVEGLMGVASIGGSAYDQFAALRASVDRLELAECSMGMTADLEAAVRAGSTMIRVGTAIFGDR